MPIPILPEKHKLMNKLQLTSLSLVSSPIKTLTIEVGKNKQQYKVGANFFKTKE